ncbi:hypothetical protein [Candidatus Paracaedibacter symbiosus]|uniref:hypothetical protein n=1 Tax=Candidatus Paracaedibacter symbiosus TaxID=244582 RepID=UPI00050A005F|nr:hypothetical protein [Candidatus Paracaedibacter symbiosus]
MKYSYLILSLVGALFLSDNSTKAADSYPKSPTQQSSVVIGRSEWRKSTQSNKETFPRWKNPRPFNCRQECTSVTAMHCQGPEVAGRYEKCAQNCKSMLATNDHYKQAIRKCEDNLQTKQYLGQIIEFNYTSPIAEPGTPESRGFLVRVLRKKTSPHLGSIDFIEQNDEIIAFLPYPPHFSIKPAEFLFKMIEFDELDSLDFEKFTDAEIENIRQDDRNEIYMNNSYKAFFTIPSTSPETIMFDTPIKRNNGEVNILSSTFNSQIHEESTVPLLID